MLLRTAPRAVLRAGTSMVPPPTIAVKNSNSHNSIIINNKNNNKTNNINNNSRNTNSQSNTRNHQHLVVASGTTTAGTRRLSAARIAASVGPGRSGPSAMRGFFPAGHVGVRSLSSRAQRDPYGVLGVSRDASKKEIKTAFRKLAKEYHPDKISGSAEEKARAKEKFGEINEAHEILSDDAKRSQFDRTGHAGGDGNPWGSSGNPFQGQGGFDAEDLFSSIFGNAFRGGGPGGPGGPGRAQGPRAVRGSDVQIRLKIPFMEAARGGEREVALTLGTTCTDCGGSGAKKGTKPTTCDQCGGRGTVVMAQGPFRMETTCMKCGGQGTIITDPCNTCGGDGIVRERRIKKIKIPPGVDTGLNMRLRGEGEAGSHGGPPGDLYVALTVEDKPGWLRDGADIHSEAPVKVTQAVLGSVVRVETLDGVVEVPVPAGTQPGDTHVLRRKGIRKLSAAGRGDHHVHFRVIVPTKLTTRHRELFEEMAKDDDVCHDFSSSTLAKGFNKLKQWIAGKNN